MRAPRKKIVDYDPDNNIHSRKVLLECGHYANYSPKPGVFGSKLKKRAECHTCWKEIDYEAWLAETMK